MRMVMGIIMAQAIGLIKKTGDLTQIRMFKAEIWIKEATKMKMKPITFSGERISYGNVLVQHWGIPQNDHDLMWTYLDKGPT